VELLTDMSQATCEVFTLTIGPLEFEVLGVLIRVDPVIFALNADPSGLIGQWLCALVDATWLDSLVAPVSQVLFLLGAV
jgi:hypothetical protein